jgi:hypothetical protein
MSDLSGVFARYTGGDPRDEAFVERWFWPWLAALSVDNVVGTGCCRSCWHAYRRSEVVANEAARERIVTEYPDTAQIGEPLDLTALDPPGERVWRLRLSGGLDPAAVSRLVRDLVPGAAASPNYVMQTANHPVLHPHFAPKPPLATPPKPSPPTSPPDSRVTVAVIDTGCITKHPWWQGVVTAAREEPPDPARAETLVRGHGTFIVGLIRSLAPEVKVVARQVPVESDFTEFRVAFEMVEAARSDRAAVINVSLGTCPIDGLPPVAMGQAVSALQLAYGDDLAIVASAGNDGSEHVVYPAAFPGVIGVGAIDAQRSRATFSNFGSWVQACAPGRHVSSYFGITKSFTFEPIGTFEGYAEWEGTSFAAPVVAARIAEAVTTTGRPARPSSGGVLGASQYAVAGLGRLVV